MLLEDQGPVALLQDRGPPPHTVNRHTRVYLFESLCSTHVLRTSGQSMDLIDGALKNRDDRHRPNHLKRSCETRSMDIWRSSFDSRG